jgi:hypothetical protein
MLQQAQFRASLPEPEEEEDCTDADARQLPKEEREYQVASTGAKVTLASAKSLLFYYCVKLPSDR